MTDPSSTTQRRGRAQAVPGPEAIAGGLVVLLAVVIAIGATNLVSLSWPSGTALNSSPATLAPSATPAESLDAINRGEIALAESLGDRLVEDGKSVAAVVDRRRSFNTGQAIDAADAFRQVQQDLVLLAASAKRLQGVSATKAVADRMLALSSELETSIITTLSTSPVAEPGAYFRTATSVVAKLAALPLILALLRQVAAAPTPSIRASNPASPRSTAGASPGRSASPSPSASSGASSGNLLVDPSFETGVGAPWQLTVGAGAAATISADHTITGGGATAARVDIAVATDERSAVALLQSGLSLLAGRRYRATALLRAETTRDVRLRIVGSDAQTYAARVFTVGPTFGPISMDATTLADDPNATFEVDLGRSTVTTWVDNASLVLVAPSP